MSFAELGLSPLILRAVEELGYREPTPIQRQAIPVVLARGDILAAAQTGTGKTAAFTLPVLTRLMGYANSSASPAMHPVRVLVLTPTRELADQVADSVRQYSQHSQLRYAVLFGGVSIDPQKEQLRRGIEIVVATPGRLLDHVEQKTIQLNRVEILVMDEADRMLDMGFLPDIRRILTLLPKTRQTLLFSATFSPEIKKLAAEFMKQPQLIEVARQNATNAKIEQTIYAVDSHRKRALLVRLLQQRDMSQVIVFCRTKQGADQLTRELKRENISVAAIHGDKAQQARIETLAAFKAGEVRVLVATDVAARGLDISDLPFVVNFELPKAPEDYVHRIGRTGRAGSSGVAISLMAEDEQKALANIEKLTRQTLKPEMMTGFWPSWMEHPKPHPSTFHQAFVTSARPSPLAHLMSGKAWRHPLSQAPREIPALLMPPRYNKH